MRRSRLTVSAVVGLIGAGACATPSSSTVALPGASAPSPVPSSTIGASDSITAQRLADRVGPRASIAAEFMQNTGFGVRHLRAAFHLEDDAYVLVGHVDADGVLRVVFPANPQDDGFVRGQRSYESAEFFAGFTEQYRFRAAQNGFMFGGRQVDSYDANVGYLFIVASWRPMSFSKFSSNGEWDSFELVDQGTSTDPRAAIREFAALLAGENREAYTLQFARYFNSRSYAGGAPYSSSSFGLGLGYGFCSGYEPLGYYSNPFDGPGGLAYQTAAYYSQAFWYRGNLYGLSSQGCYYQAPRYFGRPYVVANGPVSPNNPGTQPVSIRAFNLGKRTEPGQPIAPRVRVSTSEDNAPETSNAPAKVSPQYRQRGLITHDDPGRGPERSAPRVTVEGGSSTAERPSIQSMMSRRIDRETGDDGTRARLAGDGSSSGAGTARGRERNVDYSGRSSSERPQWSDSRPAAEAPRSQPRSESPRVESPRVESPRSETPRNAPAPHIESPRSIEAPRSAPPPHVEAPRTEAPRSSPPPASTGSTGSKPPGR